MTTAAAITIGIHMSTLVIPIMAMGVVVVVAAMMTAMMSMMLITPMMPMMPMMSPPVYSLDRRSAGNAKRSSSVNL